LFLFRNVLYSIRTIEPENVNVNNDFNYPKNKHTKVQLTVYIVSMFNYEWRCFLRYFVFLISNRPLKHVLLIPMPIIYVFKAQYQIETKLIYIVLNPIHVYF